MGYTLRSVMNESTQLYDDRGRDHDGDFINGFLSQSALAGTLDLVSIDHASNNCSFGLSFIQDYFVGYQRRFITLWGLKGSL